MFGDHFQITDGCNLSQATANPKEQGPIESEGSRERNRERRPNTRHIRPRGRLCVVLCCVELSHTKSKLSSD